MTVKMNGAQYKAFLDDDAYWTAPSGAEFYMEDDLITLNNVEQVTNAVERVMQDTGMKGRSAKEITHAAIKDTDTVRISYGFVQSEDNNEEEKSLQAFARAWLKKQTTQYLVVEADTSKVDINALKEAIEDTGGKIK